MNRNVLEEILKITKSGKCCALITLTDVSGSVPGRNGALMVLRDDGTTFGTVGGGALEFKIIGAAKEALQRKQNAFRKFELTEKGELGMACGGSASLHINIVHPQNQLIIFGAGHISQRLSHLVKNMNFDVFVIDEREGFSDLPAFEGVKQFFTMPPKEAVSQINFTDTTFSVIVTHGHKMDMSALLALSDKNQKYVGLIGSEKKITTLKKSLSEQGVTGEFFDRVHMPIGLKIDDGSPEEIAVGILAQILMVKNGKTTL